MGWVGWYSSPTKLPEASSSYTHVEPQFIHSRHVLLIKVAYNGVRILVQRSRARW